MTSSRTSGDLVQIDPDRPPWSGSLSLTIECRHARDATSGERHRVSIHEDWSVSTPHDLDAERVAMAFGGYTSCIELVDRTIPLLREGIGRAARTIRPSVRHDKRREWRVSASDAADCCRGKSFLSVRSIVEHLRSAPHFAASLELPLWQVDTILRHVARRSRPSGDDATSAARHVREADGLDHLWRSGIHPDELPQLAAYAAVVHEALPVAYYEGVAYSGHDPAWITHTLIHRPDADTAAWLAWQAPPRVDPSVVAQWGRWLGYGLSRSDFGLAIDLALSPDAVPFAVEATGWSLRTAARVVLAFAVCGCHPTPDHLRAVARHGMEYSVPGAAAVDGAVVDASGVGVTIDRTELAIMLALTGSRPALLAAIQRGCRTTADLATP